MMQTLNGTPDKNPNRIIRIVNFHKERKPSAKVIDAISVGNLVIPANGIREDEALLLEMLEEWKLWRGRNISVPPIFLCLAYGCMHLLIPLIHRIEVLRKVRYLTHLGINPK